MLQPLRFMLPLALLTFVGCPDVRPDSRPTVDLSNEERTPDPTCTGTWIAAMTVRSLHPFGGAAGGVLIQPCLEYGPGHTRACLEGAQTNRYGWAVLRVPAEMRCVHRAALKASDYSSPPVLPFATAYQPLVLNPTGGVLDVETPVRLPQLNPAITRTPLGDPEAAHTVLFADDITVSVIPGAIENGGYAGLSLGVGGGGTYITQRLSPTHTIALGPDSELSPAGDRSRWGTVSIPVTDADGTHYDASVLAGTATYDGETLLDVGALHPYASAVVMGGRLTVPLPRIGWIALYRR